MFRMISFLWAQSKIERMERKCIKIGKKREDLRNKQAKLVAKTEAAKDRIKARTDLMVRPEGVKKCQQ